MFFISKLNKRKIMEQFKLALNTGNFNNWSKILSDLRLESLTNDDLIGKIIYKLDSKAMYEELYLLMLKLSKYHSNSFQYELKEGMKILLNNK